MSGSFYFEGNGFFNYSVLTNSSVGNTYVSRSVINTSSIDMMSILGEYQNIVNVKDPVNAQDAATKKYVDDLDIVLSNVSLVGSSTTHISNYLSGSYIVTIRSLVYNGPTAIFHVTKNNPSHGAHIVRTVAAPGHNSNVFLALQWPPNSGILLQKTGIYYDGSYRVKIM